jgi:ecotin
MKNAVLLAGIALACAAPAFAGDDIAFPAAKPGYRRFDIAEATSDGAPRRIEFFVGKTMTIDCNQHWLNGAFAADDVKGAPFFTFTTDGRTSSTKMFCPQDKKKTFVSGPRMLAEASARAPLVVFVPDGYELRYDVWGVLERDKVARPGAR